MSTGQTENEMMKVIIAYFFFLLRTVCVPSNMLSTDCSQEKKVEEGGQIVVSEPGTVGLPENT